MATGRIGTNTVLTTRWSKAPTGGTTSLSGLDDASVSLVYSVGYEQVYRNGVLLSRGNDYTATNGTTITLIDATITGDIIEVFANATIPLTDTYSQSVANGKFINNTLTTTTGDIIYASAANTPARLGIGSTDQVLKVSGGVPVWDAPAAGGAFTSLASGSLSGSSVVLGSIPATYTDLRLDVFDYYASSNAYLELIITGISTNYFGVIYGNINNSTFGPSSTSGSQVAFQNSAQNANNDYRTTYYFNAYADTTSRRLISATDISLNGDGNRVLSKFEGTNSSTAAISSLTIRPSAGTFSGGTYVLYGVK